MPFNEQQEHAMRRALELALRGPIKGVNPRVGAVLITPAGEIVGEGWHRGSGTDHAEVAALKDLQANARGAANGPIAAGLTAVVTLEPCNHTGKTGPCALALIEAGVAKVIYASSDAGINSAGGAALCARLASKWNLVCYRPRLMKSSVFGPPQPLNNDLL